jgi:hypothetical protein
MGAAPKDGKRTVQVHVDDRLEVGLFARKLGFVILLCDYRPMKIKRKSKAGRKRRHRKLLLSLSRHVSSFQFDNWFGRTFSALADDWLQFAKRCRVYGQTSRKKKLKVRKGYILSSSWSWLSGFTHSYLGITNLSHLVVLLGIATDWQSSKFNWICFRHIWILPFSGILFCHTSGHRISYSNFCYYQRRYKKFDHLKNFLNTPKDLFLLL